MKAHEYLAEVAKTLEDASQMENKHIVLGVQQARKMTTNLHQIARDLEAIEYLLTFLYADRY